MQRYVSYLRVSTREQGGNGLGIEAQRQAVKAFLQTNASELTREFVEVESGGRSDRPELHSALALCRRLKATLIVAKLDRLSRNVAFLSQLMESGVDFKALDYPHADKFILHVMVAVSEHERDLIAARTRAALAAARDRGVVLGGPRLS